MEDSATVFQTNNRHIRTPGTSYTKVQTNGLFRAQSVLSDAQSTGGLWAWRVNSCHLTVLWPVTSGLRSRETRSKELQAVIL